MFDFSMGEIALLVIVALVFIGPKDLPVALRAVSRGIRAIRRLAGEFQQHLDEMVREADLSETRDELNNLRKFSMREQVSKAIDPDGQLRKTAATLTEARQDSDGLPRVPPAPPLPPAPGMAENTENMSGNSLPHEIPHNALMARRAKALEEAPAFLPPTTALRLIEESPHWHRPAFLPPEIALHYGRRVVIVREEKAGD